MPHPRKVKIGDVFEIPLSAGRRAYGQYVHQDPRMGPLIRVYDLIVDHGDVPWGKLSTVGYRFPPVITGLMAAIREGFWTVVGNLSVADFSYPKFLAANRDPRTGQPVMWFWWDESGYHRIGTTRPGNYASFEHLSVWAPSDIARRIETGENPWRTLFPTMDQGDS